MIDFSPLQDIEEITIIYNRRCHDIVFRGSRAFSNTKKIRVLFDRKGEIGTDSEYDSFNPSEYEIAIAK